MANAQIDMEEAYKRVSNINDGLTKIEEGCHKLLDVLTEASEETNLKSVDSIKRAFDELSTTMSKLNQVMEETCIATKKYADEVAEIDAEDNSIYG